MRQEIAVHALRRVERLPVPVKVLARLDREDEGLEFLGNAIQALTNPAGSEPSSCVSDGRERPE